ncbi:hypothetical protein B0H13DRAFT_1992877 [Mycena leptocephala]|nr:hypothetical protein B0H13DRAFT_1992877 [Mycena leptocephala]
MFSFSSFGTPIIFAGLLLISMTVGVTCIWDMRNRGPPYLRQRTQEKPKLWDLFTKVRNASSDETDGHRRLCIGLHQTTVSVSGSNFLPVFEGPARELQEADLQQVDSGST